jgi:hypothetical protein
MGILVWKYCEQTEAPLINYMMGVNCSEEATQEKITTSVNATFKNGYSLWLGTHLNQFLVDYDIIHVLKNETRYISWSDLSE